MQWLTAVSILEDKWVVTWDTCYDQCYSLAGNNTEKIISDILYLKNGPW